MPIGELFVREKVPSLLPIKRNRQNLPPGGFAAGSPQSLSIQIKFWSSFFKSLWFPKAKPLVARRSGRNTFIVQSAKSRLNFLLNFTFVLRDMKLNKVQFPQFLPGLLQEKSPLKKLPLKRNQQNLPPGGFAVTRTEGSPGTGESAAILLLPQGWMLGIGMQVRR